MNKKLIGIIIGVVGLALVGLAAFMLLRSQDDVSDDKEVSQIVNNEEGDEKVNGKILVAYYSATGSTKTVAEKIARNLGAEVFEIVPVEVYAVADLDWTDENSRVSREHVDESLRDVALTQVTPENWSEYETVLIGYPIWWGIAAWPVDNFVKGNDFGGKTVIPFATSASSGLGQSGELLKEMANGGYFCL